MYLLLSLINLILPIVVQALIIHVVKGVSGGDIFAYLVVLFYISVQYLIVSLIFKKNKLYFKVSVIGLLIGCLICVVVFYNYNNQLEKTRKPNVEIGSINQTNNKGGGSIVWSD